jgi:hypothetical protein
LKTRNEILIQLKEEREIFNLLKLENSKHKIESLEHELDQIKCEYCNNTGFRKLDTSKLDTAASGFIACQFCVSYPLSPGISIPKQHYDTNLLERAKQVEEQSKETHSRRTRRRAKLTTNCETTTTNDWTAETMTKKDLR